MELLMAMPGGDVSDQKLDVSAKTFGQDFNEPLVHQVVTAYMATGRAGTRAQKSRSEVRGGGIKPWRQKGTGRARAGTIRSPIWRKGGVTFAAKPQDFTQKVNKKMYRGAMRSILSELLRQKRLIAVNEIAISAPKTKELTRYLADIQVPETALIVTNDWDSNLYLSARNLPKVDVKNVQELDPVSLVRFETVVMTESAIRKLEEVLA